MELIPGEQKNYFSSDTTYKSSSSSNNDNLLYTIKFFNGLQFDGLPKHDLRLKIGNSVMLLGNLNRAKGLCNGARLLITHLAKWSIATIINSGTRCGIRVIIHRIIRMPNDLKWPFKLRRQQLPLSLCYAMTIHKSLGQSINCVGLFLLKQVFTQGQLDVAASRVTSKEGLIILNTDDEMKNPST